MNKSYSYITEIDLDGAMTMGCPKLPKDTDARIGVRRHPPNSRGTLNYLYKLTNPHARGGHNEA